MGALETPQIEGWIGPHSMPVPFWFSEENDGFDLNSPSPYAGVGWTIEFSGDGDRYLPVTSAGLRAMADAMDAFDAAAGTEEAHV